jgi:UDP-sulfoquinovose synthase
VTRIRRRADRGTGGNRHENSRLGGDGYLGWPQALYVSRRDHEVSIVDNLMRRAFDLQHGFESLLPIESPHRRVARWRELTGRDIRLDLVDLTDHQAISRVFAEFAPEAVIHFGEQRSAPFSMIDREHAVLTQVNNLVGTLNVLYCIAEHVPRCHLVKLGTMGEYGTPNIDIEEGFIEISHKGRTDVLPFPKHPGSFYHLSKVHDSHNIMFCCRAWGIRATDLNQGIVYGAVTDESATDPALHTRLDYDHVYGTALNRFCVQAVLGASITVYGEGGQTRGYIDIRDTMRCVELAILNPPERGEYRVFNQVTEQFTLAEVAERVVSVARRTGLPARVEHVPNPRVEAERHHYRTAHTRLEGLGLEPHLLTEETVGSILDLVAKHIDRVDATVLAPTIDWRRTRNPVGRKDMDEDGAQ